MFKKMRRLHFVVFFVTVLCACSVSKLGKMEGSFTFAKTLVQKINTDLLTSMTFQDLAGQGGTLKLFVMANLPEGSDFGPYLDNGPAEPFAVVLRQNVDTSISIEGYGEDAAKPILSETIPLTPAQ